MRRFGTKSVATSQPRMTRNPPGSHFTLVINRRIQNRGGLTTDSDGLRRVFEQHLSMAKLVFLGLSPIARGACGGYWTL